MQGPFTDRTLIQIGDAYEEWHNDCRVYVSLEARDTDDDTLLHRAAFRGVAQDVRDLLRLGSDVNAAGDLGHTPLHYAAMGGHRLVAEILLANGARTSTRNEWGQTAAQTAGAADQGELAALIGEQTK